MGLFSRRSSEEKAADDVEEERRERTVAQLEAGGLPVPAVERLQAIAAARTGAPVGSAPSAGAAPASGEASAIPGAAPFSSTLSVAGFAYCDLEGIRPITQVMGSSVFHVGFQWMPSFRSWGSSQELETISAAWNEARSLALGRMRQEAALAGAHAVVGVELRRGSHDFARDGVEWIATGTAVEIPGEPVPDEPALTDLSAQDFWRLHRAGHRPLGVVGHSTVYYVVASYQTQRAMQGGRFFGGARNQELEDFTQATYDARHRAVAGVRRQATALGADGIVGVSVDQVRRVHKVSTGNDSEREDLIVHVHVIGTAIAPGRAREPEPAKTVVWL